MIVVFVEEILEIIEDISIGIGEESVGNSFVASPACPACAMDEVR